MSKRIFVFFLVISVFIAFSSCESVKKTVNNINVFPLEKDVELGLQVSQEIEADVVQFPILPEAGNEQLYAYIRGIRDKILNSGQVKYKEEFVWQVKIINDPNTLNAFATPGGYIYVYTGLIKYLDSEDQLAGVMGHEIAHADLRHSTDQLTKTYGVTALLDIALGNNTALLKEVATGLIGLKFSRTHESEADAQSVIYLCNTAYNAAGAAGFFVKIQEEGSAQPPEFLSTHPSPVNRVEDINLKKTELGCKGTELYKSKYEQIKRLIK